MLRLQDHSEPGFEAGQKKKQNGRPASKIRGGQKLNKLDLSDAFQQ